MSAPGLHKGEDMEMIYDMSPVQVAGFACIALGCLGLSALLANILFREPDAGSRNRRQAGRQDRPTQVRPVVREHSLASHHGGGTAERRQYMCRHRVAES